ncbi:DNA topoisomerase IV, alpha subunit [Artomyces pyxidatus]|uniref:DNA topoisomerase IV, alpha subunit n=1 Tax=Artomyces pyxidatus TaxID=48021 RepID=A0ACB8TD80_9AGAM|nr:DNA topoisomerase IV, alpha subunit [Artomyces pyxidatus]
MSQEPLQNILLDPDDWEMSYHPALDFVFIDDEPAFSWMDDERPFERSQGMSSTLENSLEDILDLDDVDFAGSRAPMKLDDVPDTADLEDTEAEGDGSDSEEEDGDEDSPQQQAVDGIENMVLNFLTQLSDALPDIGEDDEENEKQLAKPAKIVLKIADRKKISEDGTPATRSIRFPLAMKGKGASIKPIAQFFRVADLAHQALIDDIPTTKRDLFYKDVPLFKSQRVVDGLVDDLAATVQLGRADLNIRASSKGLLCGSSFSIHLNDDAVLNATDSEGTLIPVAEDIARFDLKEDVKWILIVEKEAVFQTLCRLRFVRHPSLPGTGVIITGKGYPDLATRQLVKTLSDNLPHSIPILALVDGDAYGLDIASVYKYGSQALRHESSKLAAERVHCIGVWASELPCLGIDRDAMLPIAPADEKKARAMLRRPADKLPQRWKKELMSMLHTRRKAETEILSTVKHEALEDVSASLVQGRSPRSHPLIQYLVSKITERVEFLSSLS